MSDLIVRLKELRSLDKLKVMLGFDGFVDSIIKLIKQKGNHSTGYFDTLQEWGSFITERSGKNFSIEVKEISSKLGGNMPIMANAMARLGVEVTCVGAMGYPTIHSVFNSLAVNCKVHSFAQPGTSQAMEFDDGKIILGQLEELNKIDWSVIKSRIKLEILTEEIQTSSLIGILNWGELEKSTSYWKGLITDVFPLCNNLKSKIVFIDLSDISKRSDNDILEMLELLKLISTKTKVVLSLNHNEANKLQSILIPKVDNQNEIELIGEILFSTLTIDLLIIHNRAMAVAISKNEVVKRETDFIESPTLLTGAGDNFNAGFCFGLLMQLNLTNTLELAHATANYYITHGESISFEELIKTNN